MDLALVIPFYNEERYLPLLISSLRSQAVQSVPVVFVDNGSTDRSTAFVQECDELRSGQWTCIEERQIGKIHAVRTGVAFCRERFGAAHIGFLDSDSYPGDDSWIGTSLEIIHHFAERFGYTYSPLRYVGFDALPVFRSAYLAYERVQHWLMRNLGWLANGQGFVCSTDTMARYLERAEITTEFDLRCSLLALAADRQPHLNPTALVTSGRRIIVSPRNFAAWCFYKREFYSKKDINAIDKVNLDRPHRVDDLSPSDIGRFFSRRALKLASRHVVPLALFDRESLVLEKIHSIFGIDPAQDLYEASLRFRDAHDFLFTNRFDEVIREIESNRATAALADQLASLMREHHHEMLSPANAAAIQAV